MIKPSAQGFLAFFLICCTIYPTNAQNQLTPDMVFNLSGVDDAWYAFDNNPATHFEPRHKSGIQISPTNIIVRLKPDATCALSQIHFAAKPNAVGAVRIYAGHPGQNSWTPLTPDSKTYGNGQNGFTIYTSLSDVDFLKFVFTERQGFQQLFGTGEIALTTSGDCAYIDEVFSAEHRRSSNTFDDFMGVNHFVGKTTLAEFFGPFKNVREYLPWDHVQGHPSGGITSTSGTDHAFHFSPCFPGYDLDKYYGNLKDMGKQILGDFKESAPFQMQFDYETPLSPSGTAFSLGLNHSTLNGNYLPLMERKPGHPTDGVQPNNPAFCNPQTYAEHADALYQISLRYGQNGDEQKARFSDNANKANQGLFSWIENWNEQDKWWNRPVGPAPIDTDKEHRLSYFTPEEYMAMTLADVNPSEGALNLPLVMSGISELDETYLRGMYMAWWDLTGTDPSETFPFYALNFHHYGLNANWSHCMMPEADPFFDGNDPYAPLSRIISFSQKYLPNRKIWLTEFGYSDHPSDNTSATPNYANADHEEIQAAWLMRGFLQLYRFGIDRAFAFQLTDEGPNEWYGMFNHTGMIDRTDTGGGTLPEYRKKKAWYYLYTLRQSLEGKRFFEEKSYTSTDGRPVRMLSFLNEKDQKTHVLWIPEAERPNETTVKIELSASESYKVIRPKYEHIEGVAKDFGYDESNGLTEISGVSETPIFVIEDAEIAPTSCACAVPLQFYSGDQNAAQKLTDEIAQIAVDGEHPRCEYGKNANNRWDGAAGTTTLDIGQQGFNDLWFVEGFYVHDPMGQEGILTIEFLDENEQVLATRTYGLDGNAVYPFTNYGVFHVWKRFEDVDVKAAAIRISKTTGASVGEVVLCASPAQACVGDGSVPTGVFQASDQTTVDNVTFTWDLPQNTDASSMQAVLYDSVGQQVDVFILPLTSNWTLPISALECAKNYTLKVSIKDCEDLTSTPVSIDFQTPNCTTPPPTPSTCVCIPQLVSLDPQNAYYDLKNNQTPPNPNTSFFDPCYDQAADKLPFRLMDEQQLSSISNICTADYDIAAGSDYTACFDAQQGGFPVNECFAGWETAQYPYRAVLDFDGLQTFNGIYIYDSNDEGELGISYRETADAAWETLELGTEKSKRIKTDAWRTWRLISFSENAIRADAIRVTMYSPNARISELLLCSKESIRKEDLSLSSSTQSMKSGRFSVLPNPATDVVQVQSSGTTFEQLSIYDVSGRKVWENPEVQYENTIDISVREFPSGVYFLKAADKDGRVSTERLVVK